MKAVTAAFTFILLFGASAQHKKFVQKISDPNFFHDRINNVLSIQILTHFEQELVYKAYSTYFDRADVDLPGFKKFFVDLADDALSDARDLISHVNERGGFINFSPISMEQGCKKIRNELEKEMITRSTVEGEANRATPHICYFQSKHPVFETDATVESVGKAKGAPLGKGKSESLKKGKGWRNLKNMKEFTQKTMKPNDYTRELPVDVDSNENSSSTPSTTPKPEVQREEWKSGLMGFEDALAMERFINNATLGVVQAAVRFKDPQTKLVMEEKLMKQVEKVKRVADLLTRIQDDSESYEITEYVIDLELQEEGKGNEGMN